MGTVTAPPWSVDYRGEWPDPWLCALLRRVTFGIHPGHRWEPEFGTADEPDDEGFETQSCGRCGAVRSRRWIHHVVLEHGVRATFTGRNPPDA